MATELAKAYVQILPSADGIKGKLSNVLGGEASAAGDSAGQIAGNSLGSTIKRVIAAAGIGAALKTALSEGANLQQSIGGIETLFKDSADKVIANAQNAYMTAGLSANDYMESVTSFSASLLQGLAGDTNKAADVADMALTDMSDNANKMGTSMELIQNAYQGFAKQNYTMLDNLKLGYGGTKTEMQRLLADAQKLTGVKYDMANLSDVYEAIHVIQNEMGITGTTAKEAASTFSGSLASMKSAFSNVLGQLTLGQDIRPAMRGLINSVRTFLVGNLMPMVKNILSALPDMINGAGTILIQTLNNIDFGAGITWGTELISNLATSIVSNLPYLAEAAINIASSIGNAIINADWIHIATSFLEDLRDSISGAISECFEADDTMVNDMFGFVINGVPVVAQVVQEAFNALWDACGQIWANIGQPIWDAIMVAIQYVSDNWGSISESFSSIFQMMWEACNLAWINIGQPIWDMISYCISFVSDIFAEYMPKILEFFQSAVSGMHDTWENHLKPVFVAIGDFLNNVVKPAFEFVLKTVVEPLVANVFNVIKDLWENTLKPVFDGICDFLVGVFTNDWKMSLQGILNIVTGIFNAIVTVVEAPMNLVKDIVNKAIEYIKEKFNFDWKLPKLKMPHFTVKGEWSLNPLKVPTFSIDWYAKAMNDPMIMNSPTAFGINSLGQIMAGGEAGSEVVSGTDTLMRMIAAAVSSQNGVLADPMNNILTLLDKYLPQLANVQLVTETGALIGALAPGMDDALGRIAVRRERGN